MLDALCLIASEGPAEDDFDYEDAVVFWHSKKERRVSLFAKSKHAGKSIPQFQVPQMMNQTLQMMSQLNGKSKPAPVNCLCHLSD